MKTIETMEDILNDAVLQEEEAFEFCSGLARKEASMELKHTFAASAQEEMAHKPISCVWIGPGWWFYDPAA